MKMRMVHDANVVALILSFVLIFSSYHIEASSRTAPEIIEVVLIKDGLPPVVQGDGLWNPVEREKAPIGLTPSEMRDRKFFDNPVPSFLPSSEDFIILDPRITGVRVHGPEREIKGFIKGWTTFIFNPNPSYLPPKLNLLGKFVPRADNLYWNEIMNLMTDDKSTQWTNVSWEDNDANESFLIKPGLDELFPYWRADLFTYLYMIEVVYYFDDQENRILALGTIYMYQLIFKESTVSDKFWLYSLEHTREWWIAVYLVLNTMLVGSLLVIILRYKKVLRQLKAN